jgi:hypothetical protein
MGRGIFLFKQLASFEMCKASKFDHGNSEFQLPAVNIPRNYAKYEANSRS